MLKVKFNFILIYLTCLLVVFNNEIKAQTNGKTQASIELNRWSITTGKTTPPSIATDTSILSISKTKWLKTSFIVPETANYVSISTGNTDFFTSLFLNNNPIALDTSETEITDYLNFDTEEIKIQLNTKANNLGNLKNEIQKIQINYFSGIGILNTSIDQLAYQMGYNLQVELANFTDSDKDGKLYASLLNPSDYTVIAENNNCAFTPIGMRPIIEIPFFHDDFNLKGKTLLLELRLVDKEQNEEIIDEFNRLVHFP